MNFNKELNIQEKIKNIFETEKFEKLKELNREEINSYRYNSEQNLLQTLLYDYTGIDNSVIKYIIDNTDNLDYESETSQPSIYYAVTDRNYEITKYLIDRKVKKDRYYFNRRLIHISLEIQSHELAEKFMRLLLTKENINSVTKKFYQTPLMIAIKNNNINCIKHLINYTNCDLEIKNKDEQTALYYAYINGNSEIFKLLIEKGANIDHIYRGRTLLQILIDRQKISEKLLEQINILLDNKCNVNLVNDMNQTALIVAITYNHIDIAKRLINETNSNLDHVDNSNKFPLYYAIINFEIFKLLCEKGANINRRYNGKNIIKYLLVQNKYNMAKYLIDRGCGINSVDNRNNSAIMIELKHGCEPDIIDKLTLCTRLDINVRNNNNETALSYAMRYDTTYITLFLTLGADINGCDGEYYRTILQQSIEIDDQFVFDLVLNRGCDITIKDEADWTALRYTIAYGRINMFKRLLRYEKCDVNNSLVCAAKENQTEMMNILLNDKRTNLNYSQGGILLIYVIQNNNMYIINKILNRKYKYDFNKTNHEGNIISIIAKYNISHLFKPMLRKCYDVNVQSNGLTPLIWMIKNKCDYNAIKLLRLNKCQKNIKDPNGKHALIYSIEYNRYIVFKKLLKKSKINLQTNTGDCAIHYAIYGEKIQYCIDLINYGCDLSIKNSKNKIPYDVAERLKNNNIMFRIVSLGMKMKDWCIRYIRKNIENYPEEVLRKRLHRNLRKYF